MTSFIDFTAVAAASPLKAAHYPFPRTKELHDALAWCVTDYYAKAKSGLEFEARGLLVTGRSRVGKTREIQRLLSSSISPQRSCQMDDRHGSSTARCRAG